MSVRVSSVSFVDSRGARHTVDVEAATLLEAAALGIQRLRGSGIEGLGPATRLKIEVRRPGTKHALTMA
jgi:hypothetical protein